MMQNLILLSIISIDVLILLFQSFSLSISAHEANLLYGEPTIIQFLVNQSLNIFGHSELALRFPMMVLHIFSIILLYLISGYYLEDKRNRIWLLLFFIFLPGVLSSALIVDTAGLTIFALLLLVYVYERFSVTHTYPILVGLSVLDGSFTYLFFSLIIFAVYVKNYQYLGVNIVLLAVSVYLFGVEASGYPKGHFLDTIGLYAAIFTPVIFVYIFYILYRRVLYKELNLLWFVASVPLLLSLLLSFRQEIVIEDFAPYLIIAMPLAAQTFYASYRVRLKMFRKSYKTLFSLAVFFLTMNFIVVLFNQELYLVIDNPNKHFARKMHIAKDLAIKLKSRGVDCVQTDASMQTRLRFYGIKDCQKNALVENSLKSEKSDVTISYKYRPIYKATVTQINNK